MMGSLSARLLTVRMTNDAVRSRRDQTSTHPLMNGPLITFNFFACKLFTLFWQTFSTLVLDTRWRIVCINHCKTTTRINASSCWASRAAARRKTAEWLSSFCRKFRADLFRFSVNVAQTLLQAFEAPQTPAHRRQSIEQASPTALGRSTRARSRVVSRPTRACGTRKCPASSLTFLTRSATTTIWKPTISRRMTLSSSAPNTIAAAKRFRHRPRTLPIRLKFQSEKTRQLSFQQPPKVSRFTTIVHTKQQGCQIVSTA